MYWLEIVKAFTPVVALYIAYLTYKMNKQELERKRNKEQQEDSKKDVPLPPRSKRPKR